MNSNQSCIKLVLCMYFEDRNDVSVCPSCKIWDHGCFSGEAYLTLIKSLQRFESHVLNFPLFLCSFSVEKFCDKTNVILWVKI